MKKDAYYFPHFCNARADRKLKRVRKELGIEGYGIYFMILETLREQTDFKYPIEDIDLLADEFGTSEQKVLTVVKNYALFEIDKEEMFFSPKQLEYLKPYLEGKESKKVGGIKGNLIRYKKATKEQLASMTDHEILAFNEKFSHTESVTESDTDRLSSQRKGKESKVKEKKVNNIEARELAFYESLKEFLNEYSPDMIRAFYDYWREPTKSKKMLWETREAWDLGIRLKRWSDGEIEGQKQHSKPISNQGHTFDHESQRKREQGILKQINKDCNNQQKEEV